jgi:hypothetical protein
MDSGPITRRQCLGLAVSVGPVVFSQVRASFGVESRPGLDDWLGARLVPASERAELELLSRTVAQHLTSSGDLARVDTALRNRLISDPFELTSVDHFDQALAPLLMDFLKKSQRLQHGLGLPKGFKLEASCSLDAVG